MSIGTRRPRASGPELKSHRGCLGAYAVEFAIVFPIFFLLFYGILSFGLIFTAQQSLALAAEDGARAALRYFVPPASASASSSAMQQLQGRLDHGCDVATHRTQWLAQMVGASAAPSCTPLVKGPCALANGLPDPDNRCTADFSASTASGAVACGIMPGQQCEATLIVDYSYREHPLIPFVPLASFVVPETIRGLATVILDPAMLQPAGGGA